MTQADRVLQYLEDGNSLTGVEARELFGIMELPSVAFQLRGKGYNVETEMITEENRYGDDVSFARYTLGEKLPPREETTQEFVTPKKAVDELFEPSMQGGF